MKFVILTLAEKDLRRGQKFYETQRKGLGAYFLDSLFSDIDSLLLYAGIHRQINGYYVLLSKKFPYAIYYKVIQDEIRVYRVLDCRQDPSKTKQALR